MNVILKISLIISFCFTIVQIILVSIYYSEFNKASTMRGDEYETFTKKLFHLKDILANAMEILIIIGFLYYLVYIAIIILYSTKFYEKYIEVKDIAVQSESNYSNLVMELFLSFLIKTLPDIMIIYFCSISIEEIDIIESKGGFNELNQ